MRELVGPLITRTYEVTPDVEVLPLHAVRVPPQLSLFDGRLLLKEGRPVFDAMIAAGKQADVPVLSGSNEPLTTAKSALKIMLSDDYQEILAKGGLVPAKKSLGKDVALINDKNPQLLDLSEHVAALKLQSSAGVRGVLPRPSRTRDRNDTPGPSGTTPSGSKALAP